MKHTTPYKVNGFALIPLITQLFQSELKRPARRNLMLMILASIRTRIFRINTLTAALPVAVGHYKKKQKRLLRFINSDFPTASAMAAWCVYILRSLYVRGNRALRNLLIDEQINSGCG